MLSPRWTGPIVAGVAFSFVVGLTLYAPASAGRAVLNAYHVVPGTDADNPWNRFVEDSVDDAARLFSLGNPDKLVDMDVRVTSIQPPLGAWHGSRTIRLEWRDLGSSKIQYDLWSAPAGAPRSAATLLGTVRGPPAELAVEADGAYDVWIQPRSDHGGRFTRVGPFLLDATPPAAPALAAPQEPPGYRFQLQWTPVQDLSGIRHYELERRSASGAWETVAHVGGLSFEQDQIGNGAYEYRLRAVNGAGLASPWSNLAPVVVRAPMKNPGPGALTYGVHANYTGFLRLWDLDEPETYVTLSEIPASIRDSYLGAAPGIEVSNATLRAVVEDVVDSETNTIRIAERLFVYLFDETDYDRDKVEDPDAELQRAGLTLDRGKGICGDLAVLYVTLLRIAGVPARPIHGYLDNSLSNVGGFHMWVEVYVGPVNSDHAWMPVDVSGVTGSYEPERLFSYFGLFNPDYLALGEERNFDRFPDEQWNTWARFRYVKLQNAPTPEITDEAHVDEYETEVGRLFFEVDSKRTEYRACQSPNPQDPTDPCPHEPGPGGYDGYYNVKGLSKKRIDYGATVESNLPLCLKVELRYPVADDYGAVAEDQSAIFSAYEDSASSAATMEEPNEDGWVVFWDGTDPDGACEGL